MKRLIIFTIITLILSAGAMANTPGEQNRGKPKSKIEKFLQKLPIDATAGIEYTYISANILKGIYSMFPGGKESPFGTITTALKSIRYVKKFETTTADGYSKLKEKAAPLLACDDEIMGMNLLTVNSENRETTTIYSNKENTLIIAHNSDKKELTLTFIAGISMEKLSSLTENGFNLNF